jgi:hypothetical protein
MNIIKLADIKIRVFDLIIFGGYFFILIFEHSNKISSRLRLLLIDKIINLMNIYFNSTV